MLSDEERRHCAEDLFSAAGALMPIRQPSRTYPAMDIEDAYRNYPQTAADELCLLVQVETRDALREIEAIASVVGVDGVFIGPADLAASLGYPGQLNHPAVISAVEEAIRRICASGKAAGILTQDASFACRCIEIGTTFTAVAIDAAMLIREADRVAARFKT
jgi:4-hydroxy-2-oxoheptanedioate aldolase